MEDRNQHIYAVLYGLYSIIKMQLANMGPVSFAKNVSYVLGYADESDMGHTV